MNVAKISNVFWGSRGWITWFRIKPHSLDKCRMCTYMYLLRSTLKKHTEGERGHHDHCYLSSRVEWGLRKFRSHCQNTLQWPWGNMACVIFTQAVLQTQAQLHEQSFVSLFHQSKKQSLLWNILRRGIAEVWGDSDNKSSLGAFCHYAI